MSEQQERGSPQRTVMFGVLFVILLLLAVLVGYVFLGKGTYSAPSTDTPAAVALVPPAAPSDLTADVVAVFDVPVGWKDNSNNEDGFNIYRQRVDVLSGKEKAGDTGKDAVTFLDEGTFCGATYQYTVASFNAAGESPTTPCWQITLPACPAPFELKAAAGDKSSPTDFYLSADGVNFMSDQAGQNGLMDLGDIGNTSLDHVTMPKPAAYQKAGLPVVAGHTYAVLMKDGQSVEVFTVNSIDAKLADVTGIVWHPGSTKVGACQPLGDVTPGGACISGDNICDPNCSGGPDRDCPSTTETATATATATATEPCTAGQGKDCVTPTVQITESRTPPPCVGANCVTPTVPVTESTQPPGTCPPGSTDPACAQQCFCEVSAATNAWDGNYVCTTLDGKPISSVVDTNKCPPPVCGNGVVEGNEQCDGGKGCSQGEVCQSDCTCTQRQTCTCIPDTTAGSNYGHCQENPQQRCQVSP